MKILDFNLIKKQRDAEKKSGEDKKTIKNHLLDLYAVDNSEFLTLLPDVEQRYKKRRKSHHRNGTGSSFDELEKARNVELEKKREEKRNYLVSTGRFTKEEVKKLNNLELEIEYEEPQDIYEKVELLKELLWEEQFIKIKKAEALGSYVQDYNMLQLLFSYIIEYGNSQSKHNTNKYLNSGPLSNRYRLSFFNLTPSYSLTYKQDINPLEFKSRSNYIRSIKYGHSLLIGCRWNINRVFYRFIYFFLKDVKLFNESDDLSLYRYPKLIDNMFNEYLKHKHHRYPTYLWHNHFQDPILQKYINMFMIHGKKEKSEQVIYKVSMILNSLKELSTAPFLRKATLKVRPSVQGRSIPYGKNTKVVPHLLSDKRRMKFSIKWFKKQTLKNKKPLKLHMKLIETLYDIINKRGYAFDQISGMHSNAFDSRLYIYQNYYLKKNRMRRYRDY